MANRFGKYGKNLLLIAAFTAAAASGALLSNVHQGEAWGGWWGPWEPENYWDPIRISWRDTFDPGHYFLGDLSGQGGSVYDYTRIIKSVLFGEKFLHIVENIAEQLGIDIIDRLHLDPMIMNIATNMAGEKQNRATELHSTAQKDLLTESSSFHSYNEGHEAYDAPRNLVRQRQEISASAVKYAQIAESAIADGDRTRETVHRLMEAAANAKGETELRQIMEQLNAISVADQSQVTALLAAKVQLENDQRQVDLDKEIEWEKQAQDAKIIVTDPYNEERAAVSGYDREKPRGFVRFK